MGVDWLTCNYCGENFPDCGDYVYCEECGTSWCSEECAEKEGYKEVSGDEESTCNFCRGEDFEDGTLLKFALELLKMQRSELIVIYKNKAVK